MNILSMFKTSNRWSHLINKLLMVSLWCSVIVFFAIAILVFIGGWNLESVRIALIISGIGVGLLVFTLMMKRSVDQSLSPKTITDYYDSALEIEETKGIEASREIYETICKTFDTNLGPAYLALASIHLEKNEEEKATQYIHKAAKENWIWYHSGLELLAEYYKKNRLDEKLAALSEQMDRVKELEERASEEIYYFSESDSLQAHDQSLSFFSPIIRILSGYLQFNELFIVEKKLNTIPDRKVYVFALVVDQKDEVKKYEEKIYRSCYEVLVKPLGRYMFFEYTISFLFLSREDSRDRAFIQKLKNIEGARVNQKEMDHLIRE
mgnify:CR=1 FL=1